MFGPFPEIAEERTATAQPVGSGPETPLPSTAEQPAVESPRCPDPRAVITSPGLNASVSGMVPVFGTAMHEEFKFYKLEYGIGAHPGDWSYFDGGETPVKDGRLGTLNAGALPPGTYGIRVVVVDVTGNFQTPCQTAILIR